MAVKLEDLTIAVVTANLGNFEKHQIPHIPQNIRCDFYNITDKEFPRRYNAMTPRLQARIVKMFMWEFVPEHDIYLWIDSSCMLSDPGAVRWFLSKLGDGDMVVFRHPNRASVQEEADYLKKRLAKKCPYITPRYDGELIDEQLDAILDLYEDDRLFASTAFMYRRMYSVDDAMKEWWYHTSRYHSIDQLSFPYCIRHLDVRVIPDSYLKIPYITYVRNRK